MGKIRRRIGQFVRKPLEVLSGYKLVTHGSGIVLLQGRKTPRDTERSRLYTYLSGLEFKALFDVCGINLVLDVGANRGQFAARLRSETGYKGNIFSFEPVSSVYQLLKDAAASDPHWKVFRTALGSCETDKLINVSDSTEFSSFLAPNEYCGEHFKEESRVTRRETVQVRRLDSFLEAAVDEVESARIFLKMDTQGFDLEVFSGLGSRSDLVYGLQSEVSLIPLYKDMPHWTETIARYENAGLEVSGMFPVSRKSLSIVEYDCLMIRPVHTG